MRPAEGRARARAWPSPPTSQPPARGQEQSGAGHSSGLPDPAQEASVLLAEGSVVLADLLQVTEGLLPHLRLDLGQCKPHAFSPAPACRPGCGSSKAARGPSRAPPITACCALPQGLCMCYLFAYSIIC